MYVSVRGWVCGYVNINKASDFVIAVFYAFFVYFILFIFYPVFFFSRENAEIV